MIIGTAGHIDHGKTSLVKALTGVDADRLPEERARGITLDLGYAYAPLPDGQVLGFVDVPGHERLVHNMLAGATGIDFVLLVVAADDGPMPQTREHLQIIDLLGLTRGAIALTKVDRVPGARMDEVGQEIGALVASSGLADAPVFPVSAVTGEGVAALRQHLDQACAAMRTRSDAGYFRLAIDRCFTLKGAGTVVTGTAHSGRVQVGEELMLSPPSLRVRVRSIHAQDRPTDAGKAGQRCALNLSGPGFDKAIVRRGNWLLAPEVHAPTQRVDVRLRLLASEARPLAHWTPVHFHLGAIDVTARVALLEGDALAPGSARLAQIVLDKPVGALHGDRFVLRDQSATRTLGGGMVLDPFPPQRGRRAAPRLEMLQAWDTADPVVALQKLLQTSALGVDLRHFRIAWNLDEAQLGELLICLPIRRVDDGGNLFAVDAIHWTRLLARIEAALAAEHERAPDMVGVGRERLRRLTDPALMQPIFDAALRELVGAQRLAQSGSWLHHPQHQVKLTLADEALWGKVYPLLESQPFQPPRVRDLARTLLMSEEEMRQFLKRTARLGLVYPVAHDHYFSRRAVGELAAIVRELNAEDGAATASRFRDRIDTGRKLAIHVLEFFDRVGYTRRVGDTHLLRQPALFGEEAALM